MIDDESLSSCDRRRPGENFKQGKVVFLRTAKDFISVKDVKRIFDEFPERRRDPQDDVPYTLQELVTKYSDPASPYGEFSLEELKQYWKETCLPSSSDCPRQVANVVASGVTDFCQDWNIEMVICAYCFSTNSPLIHELTKRLGIYHTVFS